MGRLVGALGRKKLLSRISSISASVRDVAGRLGGLRDGAHHVVDRLAVAELGGEPGLEADQVAQAERQAAVDERGQLAVGDRDRVAVARRRRASMAGGTMSSGCDLQVGKLPVVRARRRRACFVTRSCRETESQSRARVSAT